MGEMRLDIERA